MLEAEAREQSLDVEMIAFLELVDCWRALIDRRHPREVLLEPCDGDPWARLKAEAAQKELEPTA